MKPNKRLDFLNSRPPPNYVAGLGRGATGFTTRSDIGPARAAPDLPDWSAAAAPGVGREDEEGWEKGYEENQTFEAAGLFLNAQYDEDDKEADAIWDFIHQRMDSRRKSRREAKLKEEIEKYRASNPKITDQFADLTMKLHTVSHDEWDSIPEVLRKKFETFVHSPIPDTLLEKATIEKELQPVRRDLTAIGEARTMLLSAKLDSVSVKRDSVSGPTAVDPEGYLASLKALKTPTNEYMYDLIKARFLFKNLTKTNPKNPYGWICAARIEELDNNMKVARLLIKRGLEECPKNEDVLMEACRLTEDKDAKALVAKGIKLIPNSVKLWLAAAQLEHDEVNKSRVLRKGLEHIPDSALLWKAVVDIANKEDAHLLLQKAVECCPHVVELWLALSRLCPYAEAVDVLNKARDKLPEEPKIWIHSAQLEEDNDNPAMVDTIIQRGIAALEGVAIDWENEALACETKGFHATSQAITKHTPKRRRRHPVGGKKEKRD